MTVTTIPAQSHPSASQPHQQRCFSSTPIEEGDKTYQRARTEDDSTDQRTYVLTLLTDKAHHESMTSLRTRYFPPKLNKLEAHITLFHALPGSKLDAEILPAIQDMTDRTAPYRIRATEPVKHTKGVGIAVDDDIDHANKGREGRGRNMTRIIHAELRKKWSGWLSEQDSSPPKIHYTVMNKVNDEHVIKGALTELKELFARTASTKDEKQGLETPTNESEPEALQLVGEVQGLTLWRYQRSGHWTNPKHFLFASR